MADGRLQILLQILTDAVGAEKAKELMRGLKIDTGKATEEAHKFNLKGKEMRELMHSLNRIAPGTGMFLKAAFNPELIGIIALVVVIEKVVQKMEEAKKKAEELRVESASNWKTMSDAAQQFYSKVDEANDRFVEQFKELYESQKTLEEQTRKTTTAIESQRDTLIALSKLRGEDKKKQDEIAMAAEKSALAAKENQLAQTRLAQAGLDAKVKESGSPMALQMGAHFASTIRSIDLAIGKMSEDLKKAKTPEEGDKLRSSIQSLEEDKRKVERDQRAADHQRDLAQQAAFKNQQAVIALEKEVAALRGQAAVKETGAIGEEGGMGGIVARGLAAIQFARAHGGKVSAEQQQAVAGLNAVLSAVGRANKQTIETLLASTNNLEAFNSELRKLKARQDAIAKYLGVN